MKLTPCPRVPMGKGQSVLVFLRNFKNSRDFQLSFVSDC